METDFENTCKDEMQITQLLKKNAKLKRQLDAKDVEITQIKKTYERRIERMYNN